MSDAQQLSNAADRERAYQESALQQVQQIARDPQLGQQQRTELISLAAWSIAASTANWSLLQVAQQALANPLIVPGQPFPTALIDAARERLRQLGGNNQLSAEATAVIRRQAAALERCAKSIGADIFRLNQPQLDAALDAAKTSGDLNRVEQQYRVRDAASGGYGTDSVEKLKARRAELAEADRLARESANAVSAADAAKRQVEAQKRLAELRARLPACLAVATRFAEASDGGDEARALAELSRDVVMSTPNGTYRGFDQVVAAVRQQSASGMRGSIGRPRIEGDRIVSFGRVAGSSISTTFSFDDQNRISRIDIRL